MIDQTEIAAGREVTYLPCLGEGYEVIECATARTVGFVHRSPGRGRAYWDFYSPYKRFILTGPSRGEAADYGLTSLGI